MCWLQVLDCSLKHYAALRPVPVQQQLHERQDIIYIQKCKSDKAYQTPPFISFNKSIASDFFFLQRNASSGS